MLIVYKYWVFCTIQGFSTPVSVLQFTCSMRFYALCAWFQYETDAELESLKQLLVLPTEPESVQTPPDSKQQDLNTMEARVATVGNDKQVDDVTAKMAATDLDSDDDLEPYDLSNDTPVTSHAAPRYVRQCMQGEEMKDFKKKYYVPVLFRSVTTKITVFRSHRSRESRQS